MLQKLYVSVEGQPDLEGTYRWLWSDVIVTIPKPFGANLLKVWSISNAGIIFGFLGKRNEALYTDTFCRQEQIRWVRFDILRHRSLRPRTILKLILHILTAHATEWNIRKNKPCFVRAYIQHQRQFRIG